MRYRVLVGLNYCIDAKWAKRLQVNPALERDPTRERRAERDTIIDDLLPHDIPWLLECGAIEEYQPESEEVTP